MEDISGTGCKYPVNHKDLVVPRFSSYSFLPRRSWAVPSLTRLAGLHETCVQDGAGDIDETLFSRFGWMSPKSSANADTLGDSTF